MLTERRYHNFELLHASVPRLAGRGQVEALWERKEVKQVHAPRSSSRPPTTHVCTASGSSFEASIP